MKIWSSLDQVVVDRGAIGTNDGATCRIPAGAGALGRSPTLLAMGVVAREARDVRD